MSSRTPIAAVILAAGNGKRMGGKYKQFLNVKGRPTVCYSLDAFLDGVTGIDVVIVVAPEKRISLMREILHRYHRDSAVEVIAGGKTRRASIHTALRHLARRPGFLSAHGYVVIHDAARPLVTKKTVRQVLNAAKQWGASVASVPAIDTLLETEGGLVQHVKNKENMCYSYTPQAFVFSELLNAHEKASRMKNIPDTADDLEIILATGAPLTIKAVESYPNFKLTYPSDIRIIEALL